MASGVRLGGWYRLAVALLVPCSRLTTRRDWRGLQHLPRAGGVLVAANHLSLADPMVLTDYLLYGARRPPRFLAKRELFRGRGPVGGLVARALCGAGQIPVDRGAATASDALQPAVAALRAGECVAIYPEGTVTRDPARWPMAGRTGVARLALLAGVPVVPVGQWGAHRVHDTYRSNRLRLWPRQPVLVQAGPPVDLSAYAGRELTEDLLHEATAAVMAAVTRELEQLRGEPAPAAVLPGRA